MYYSSCKEVSLGEAVSHLAVWVWVGAAHDVAFVFKHLHPAVGGPQVGNLMGPLVYHLPHLHHCHQREGDIRTRMEAHHSTVRGGNGTEMGPEELYQVSHMMAGESIDKELFCMTVCVYCVLVHVVHAQQTHHVPLASSVLRSGYSGLPVRKGRERNPLT